MKAVTVGTGLVRYSSPLGLDFKEIESLLNVHVHSSVGRGQSGA